jgi:predicted SPOUT superfamily RNA methylase MTH1
VLFNAQTPELRANLVGQIGRAAAIFNIDEVVIVKDNRGAKTANFKHDVTGFFTRNLEYMETPQYLRKLLFPIHPDLKYSGMLNPLDTPHHLRFDEESEFREGVVVKRPVAENSGSWVNIGLKKDCKVNMQIQPNTRVTVKLSESPQAKCNSYLDLTGEVVSPAAPRETRGLYWGYTVRVATSFTSLFSDSPYEGGYDLTIGTSDKGEAFSEAKVTQPFKHALIAFGGLAGLEDIIEADESIAEKDPRQFFSLYLNTCPTQGTRTIRTEEAVYITLATLARHLATLGD